MFRWIIYGIVAYGGYRYYKSRQTPYAGYVSMGWGGNAHLNTPGVYDPTRVVGEQTDAAVYSPPGVKYGPSETTNEGSGGNG